jgi:hypothetical protein
MTETIKKDNYGDKLYRLKTLINVHRKMMAAAHALSGKKQPKPWKVAEFAKWLDGNWEQLKSTVEDSGNGAKQSTVETDRLEKSNFAIDVRVASMLTEAQCLEFSAIMDGNDGNGGGVGPGTKSVYGGSRFVRLGHLLAFNQLNADGSHFRGMSLMDCLARRVLQLDFGRNVVRTQVQSLGHKMKDCAKKFLEAQKPEVVVCAAIPSIAAKLIQLSKEHLERLAKETPLPEARALIPFPSDEKYCSTDNVGVLDGQFLTFCEDWLKWLSTPTADRGAVAPVNADVLIPCYKMQYGVTYDFELFRCMWSLQDWADALKTHAPPAKDKVLKEEFWIEFPPKHLPMPPPMKQAFNALNAQVSKVLVSDSNKKVSHMRTHTHTHTHTHTRP